MLNVSTIKVVCAFLVFVLCLGIWPVYEGFAYKGKVSFPPFYQFIDIPNESPKNQSLYKTSYKNAGDIALAAIDRHKKVINTPAISAAIAIDGELVWTGVSGWSDIENNIPVSADTQFRVGSTSKALTGTALARMVDAKQINIDKPINVYMNNLPKDWHQMTARQLVSHTSGLPHYKENTDYLGLYRSISLSTRYKDVEDALSIFDDSELLFTPGTQFSYSTFGTVLLSNVIEKAAGTSYLDVMHNEIFEPLNMQATMAEYEADNSQTLASFYWNNKGTSNRVRQWREVDLSHRLAGGGFISTSSDLVKMGSAFLDRNFISQKTREEFWTPQVLPNGSEVPNGYSLGWRFITLKLDEQLGEISFANHGGVSRGAQSWLMVIPEHNMAIAININANTDVFWDFGKVSLDIAKAFILERNKIKTLTSKS